MNETFLIKGHFIDTPDKYGFRVRDNQYLLIKNGLVDRFSPQIPEEYCLLPVLDYSQQIIIPSFIDLHIHAPQFLQRGIGLDLELIEWLEQYTFPLEKKFADIEIARQVYPHFVDSLYRQGTLRASLFSTIHSEATIVLAEECEKKGISTLIGKINMDCHSPSYLTETTAKSLKATEQIINHLQNFPRQKPILTPRFAPCCSPDLMKGLSHLAEQYQLPVQTHISENTAEVEWVKELYPDNKNYHDVYEKCGLYRGEGFLLAHGVYLDEEERARIRQMRGTVIHCPEANLNLASGIMPLSCFLDEDLLLGIGSDVGAGQNISMARVIVRAVQSSKALHTMQPENRVIKLYEAFYLATRGNGSFLGNIGCFEKGFPFDALVVNDSFPFTEELSVSDRLSRFLYTGDDRNIDQRFLRGKMI